MDRIRHFTDHYGFTILCPGDDSQNWLGRLANVLDNSTFIVQLFLLIILPFLIPLFCRTAQILVD